MAVSKRTTICCQGCYKTIPISEARSNYLCNPCHAKANKRAVTRGLTSSEGLNPVLMAREENNTLKVKAKVKHQHGRRVAVPEGQEVNFAYRKPTPLPLDELERQLSKVREEGPVTSEDITLQDCHSCGAQVEILNRLAVGECLFCGNKATSGRPSFDYKISNEVVVPFGITHNDALERAKAHLRKKRQRGSRRAAQLLAELSFAKLRKVFLPFWAFDCEVETDWDAIIDYWEDPPAFKKLLGAKGRWSKQPVKGYRGHLYHEWIVCASKGLSNEVVAQIAPFELVRGQCGRGEQQLQEIPVERCQIRPREAWPLAVKGIQEKEKKASEMDAHIHLRFGSSEDLRLNAKVDFKEPTAVFAILPAYVFHYQGEDADRACIVAVNGETGEVGSALGEADSGEFGAGCSYNIFEFLIKASVFLVASPFLLLFSPILVPAWMLYRFLQPRPKGKPGETA